MKHKTVIIILAMLAWSLPSLAQKEVRQLNRSGNKEYKSQNYQQAEIEYRKAIETNPTDVESRYNLANTLYQTERGEEAGKLYNELLQEIELLPKERAADVAHNAGNLMMAAQDYAAAVEFYKESLRCRPTDEETRYNLALAQKLLEEEGQEGGSSDQNEQQEQEEEEQQQQEDQQNEPQPQNDQPNKPQEEQSQQPQRMSQDNAEKILDAYLQDERDTQKKVEQMKKQQQQGKRSRPKNW